MYIPILQTVVTMFESKTFNNYSFILSMNFIMLDKNINKCKQHYNDMMDTTQLAS